MEIKFKGHTYSFDKDHHQWYIHLGQEKVEMMEVPMGLEKRRREISAKMAESRSPT